MFWGQEILIFGAPGTENIDFGTFFEVLGWFKMVLCGLKKDLAGFMTFQVTWEGPRGKNSILGPPTPLRAGASREGKGRVPLPLVAGDWRIGGTEDTENIYTP